MVPESSVDALRLEIGKKNRNASKGRTAAGVSAFWVTAAAQPYFERGPPSLPAVAPSHFDQNFIIDTAPCLL